MLTLFSYPELYGLADNNPYGLKVYAFLRLAHLAFRHEHILDASRAPRGQLPYLTDGELVIGDSDAIIHHLIERHGARLDDQITPAQHDTGLMVRRTLDDLYWVMSYSRWKDPRFWPQFKGALLRTHPELPAAALDGAQEYNLKRYHYQGIGRFEPDDVYRRGTADLGVIANLLPASGFVFGTAPCSVDAGIYGFVANIYFYEIDTPLKAFVLSQPKLVAHCQAMHRAL
jgi:glutathione S-transferase